jgi:hypothetical protein
MDALTKVAQYLGYASEVRIKNLKVVEWAKVYWVHIQGRRPTLLSKKLVDRSAHIRVKFTVAGESITKDEKTGRYFIIRNTGSDLTGYQYSIREIQEKQASIEADFSRFNSEISHIKWTDKPSTVRELMIFKAINNR